MTKVKLHQPLFDGRSLGSKIQELRAKKDKTLEWLALETNFTKGYLSRIENGKKTPPIASLVRIANALGVELTVLLSAQTESTSTHFASTTQQPMHSIVRVHERPKVVRGASAFGYNYVSLTKFPASRHMEPFLFTFPKEIDKQIFFEHDGEEFLFIISGEVEWQIGHEKFILMPGDSIYIDSRMPHRGRAINGDATAIVVVHTPHRMETIN